MIQTTTGNLTNVRNNAKFPFGVAAARQKGRGSADGGGNIYFFKKSTPESVRRR